MVAFEALNFYEHNVNFNDNDDDHIELLWQKVLDSFLFEHFFDNDDDNDNS